MIKQNKKSLIQTCFFSFLDKAKEEINNLIHKNKSKWELEIEQSFERLKKVS